MRGRAHERLVQVAVAESAYTAAMLHDLLLSVGVRALVRNRDAATGLWLGPIGSPYSHELLVLEGDFDRAAAILAQHDPLPELPPAARLRPKQPRPRRRWWR